MDKSLIVAGAAFWIATLGIMVARCVAGWRVTQLDRKPEGRSSDYSPDLF